MADKLRHIGLPDILSIPTSEYEQLERDHAETVMLRHGNSLIIETFLDGINLHVSASLGMARTNDTNAELQSAAYHQLGITSAIDSVTSIQVPSLMFHIGSPNILSRSYDSDVHMVVTQQHTETEPYKITAMQLFRGALPDAVQRALAYRSDLANSSKQVEAEAEVRRSTDRQAQIATFVAAALAHNPKPRNERFFKRGSFRNRTH